MNTKIDFSIQDRMGFFTCWGCGEVEMTRQDLSFAEVELAYQKFMAEHKEHKILPDSED